VAGGLVGRMTAVAGMDISHQSIWPSHPTFPQTFSATTQARERLLSRKNGESKSNLPHSSIHNPKLYGENAVAALSFKCAGLWTKCALADIADGISNEQW